MRHKKPLLGGWVEHCLLNRCLSVPGVILKTEFSMRAGGRKAHQSALDLHIVGCCRVTGFQSSRSGTTVKSTETREQSPGPSKKRVIFRRMDSEELTWGSFAVPPQSPLGALSPLDVWRDTSAMRDRREEKRERMVLAM
ncbi:hypothetical protein BD311DRAFT_555647 [Dichomitus squalens]|uniref:Uncharacterized protein n=1 Tax=Dichomitus squalens TaxID=114155 RepID=A0A4V2JZD6_9APHY|nr:hypothetical protein BD311DRAFT_555647 [Dichomitus squalens]